MRVFIIAKSKRHTQIYYYFKKAFQRLGHQTYWIKYLKLRSYLGERAASAFVKSIMLLTKPDLLFFHAHDISHELLVWAKSRMPVVMYYDDGIKSASPRHFEEVLQQGQLADVMYLTIRGEVPEYRALGINAKFITGGCDPAEHRMVDSTEPLYQSDVAFIGKPNTPERTDCMRQLSKKFDLKLWGKGWDKVGLDAIAADVYTSEYRKICAGAKIILGWNIDPTVDLFLSNRTWYTLGCGGFLLTAYAPKMEELFERGKHLDWFETVEECCDKIKYYLQHDEERQLIARNGFQLAHNQYSYDKMVEIIIRDIRNESLKRKVKG